MQFQIEVERNLLQYRLFFIPFFSFWFSIVEFNVSCWEHSVGKSLCITSKAREKTKQIEKKNEKTHTHTVEMKNDERNLKFSIRLFTLLFSSFFISPTFYSILMIFVTRCVFTFFISSFNLFFLPLNTFSTLTHQSSN